MKTLRAFYTTPLGQKMIRSMPEISQDLNGQMLAIVQQRLPGLIERVKAELATDARGDSPATPDGPADARRDGNEPAHAR